MNVISTIMYLFAGKPKAFGPKAAASSIIKQSHKYLTIEHEGAIQDEQGNKILHGGPFMAVHQYSQDAYLLLAAAFPNTLLPFQVGTIGENISAPNMNEKNVFIGDRYKIAQCILKVVSPRAPCAKINHRYGVRKIDTYIAKQTITGWYYSVEKEGTISVNDDIELLSRQTSALSVAQVWQLRQLHVPCDNPSKWLKLANQAKNDSDLAPEWQAHMQRLAVKLAKYCV